MRSDFTVAGSARGVGDGAHLDGRARGDGGPGGRNRPTGGGAGGPRGVRAAGIGPQASARASWLIDPAPRLVGVATGSGPRAGESAEGASVTSTQSSMAGGDDQSRSRAASQAAPAGWAA